MYLNHFLVRCKRGESIIVSLRCSTMDQGLRFLDTILLSGCSAESYSFNKMLDFGCHVSYVYHVGSLSIEVGARAPIRLHLYFKSSFLNRLERTYQY